MEVAEMVAASSTNSANRGYQWNMNNLLSAEVECRGPAHEVEAEEEQALRTAFPLFA